MIYPLNMVMFHSFLYVYQRVPWKYGEFPSQFSLHRSNDEASASEILAGPICAPRMGPHWPPPGPERPDPLKTRKALALEKT